MRHPAGVRIPTDWAVSEVRLRTSLLPAVHLFRYFEPVRVYAAHPPADCAERPAQSVYVLCHARPSGKGNVYPKFSSAHGCANGLRESLQKIDRVARTILSASTR